MSGTLHNGWATKAEKSRQWVPAELFDDPQVGDYLTPVNDRPRKLISLLRYLVILFAVASLALFFYQCIRNINKFATIDLTSYIRASDCFFNGGNPYVEASRRYIYPLFLLLIVYPFQFLMSSAALKGLTAAIWSLGLYLSFTLALTGSWKYLYGDRSHKEALKRHFLPLCLIVVMLHPALQDEFLNGQVNLLVLGATVAFFLLVDRNKMFWGALFLAAAASIKISPGLCLLYPLLMGRYRTVFYFFPLLALFTVGIPWLINPHSLDYYRYFVGDVMPSITGSDFAGGFKSFSVVSTLSYIFHIAWYPPLKIAVVCALAAALCAPIIRYGHINATRNNRWGRFVTFAAIISVIPLTFPMSEAHHLLILVIPGIAIVAYWQHLIVSGKSLFHDRMALLFMLCIVGLHVGHGLKDTPIRLISLIGIYVGMILLLKGPAVLPNASSSGPTDATIPIY
jgi:hypothetical protein